MVTEQLGSQTRQMFHFVQHDNLRKNVGPAG